MRWLHVLQDLVESGSVSGRLGYVVGSEPNSSHVLSLPANDHRHHGPRSYPDVRMSYC